jgi:hypothetical protein
VWFGERDAHPPGQELLHQAMLLPLERGAARCEQGQFVVGCLEHGGDALLFFYIIWQIDFLLQEGVEHKAQPYPFSLDTNLISTLQQSGRARQ